MWDRGDRRVERAGTLRPRADEPRARDRGPDEHGTWTHGGVALAARRLRVVDLQTGQQPLANEEGSLRLVANGEIYNADELRDALARLDRQGIFDGAYVTRLWQRHLSGAGNHRKELWIRLIFRLWSDADGGA